MITIAAPIRVLVVDDSVYVRMVVTRLLESNPGIKVVGQAGDGKEALALARQLQPDVMTLDVEMPQLNGLEVLERLLPEQPVPVVMLSSFTRRGADVTLRALELGAVDFVGKPGSAGVPDLQTIHHQLLAKVRQAAQAQVHPISRSGFLPTPRVTTRPVAGRTVPTVLIASSTGGPSTLDYLLSALPEDLHAAIAITQHMSPHFTQALAERLDNKIPLTVHEADEGDALARGNVLIAPGDYHMSFNSRGRVHLSQDPAIWGVRPAADPMMQSAASHIHTPLIGIVLTGMGHDGAQGVVAIKQAGGRVLAEAEESCVVYGMPKAAVETGSCDSVLALPDLPEALVQIVNELAA